MPVRFLHDTGKTVEANFYKGFRLFNFVFDMANEKSFLVSDESRNSYGIRIITAGGDFSRFLKNPVMLDLHERSNSTVLGRWENLRTDGPRIYADPVWDDNDPFAKNIHRKVDEGFIKGCSIGIEPIETVYNDVDEIVEVTKWILKEISIASVPSNENALTLYDKDGNVMNEERIMTFAAGCKNTFTQLSNMKNLKIIAKVLNLADGATEDDVTEKVSELVDENKAYKDNEIKLKDKNKKLSDKVTELETAAKEFNKQRSILLVDSALSANKILPEEKEMWIELADEKYDTAKKLLDAKKPHQSITTRLDNKDTNLVDEKTKDWGWAEFHKANKLAELKLNDFDRFKELYKKEFKKEYPGQ